MPRHNALLNCTFPLYFSHRTIEGTTMAKHLVPLPLQLIKAPPICVWAGRVTVKLYQRYKHIYSAWEEEGVTSGHWLICNSCSAYILNLPPPHQRTNLKKKPPFNYYFSLFNSHIYHRLPVLMTTKIRPNVHYLQRSTSQVSQTG